MAIHAEGGKCWAYGTFSDELLASARKEFYGDQDNLSQESLALFAAVERCVSSPGDDVNGLFELLDNVGCYSAHSLEGLPPFLQSTCSAVLVYLRTQPYLDQGGKRATVVNGGYPPKGRTMLMVAAMQGKLGCVQLLLEEMGADPDVATASKRETALHLAAFGGHYEVVSALLQHGASVALVNEYNETAEQSALAASKAKDAGGGKRKSPIGARSKGDECKRCGELIARYRASREMGDRGI